MIIKKYEGSKAYKDGKKNGNMSIDIYEKEKKILNDPYKLKKFNETITELMKYDLIKVTWVDKNNIADKIHFNLKNIDKFYEMSEIEKKDTLLENTLISIEVVKNNITQYWIIDYLNSLIDEAKSKRNLPKVIEQKGENLFNSLLGIDDVMKNEDTMLERLFSKKYLKNSKAFEKTMRGIIVSIIRKFNKDIDPELEEAEILELVGIEKTNNDLHIKGNMKIRLNSEIIDLGKMVYGTSLNKETLRNLEIVECSATKVISIENKANFLTEAKTSTSEELLIFSSGFFSPIEKQFLLQIKDYYHNRGKGTAVEYYHSGDYDFGGFVLTSLCL